MGFSENYRILWTIAIVTSMILCMYSIRSVWLKWQNEPVVLIVDSKTIPISEIPFPAIVICPIQKIPAIKFNYTAIYRSLLELDDSNSQQPTEDELRNRIRVAEVYTKPTDQFIPD